jgi:excisionase family DNA binding protein
MSTTRTARTRTRAWSVDQFAAETSVSRDTVLRGIADGSIPAYKIRTQWRIPASFLDELQSCGR